jgi:hypothetical protein
MTDINYSGIIKRAWTLTKSHKWLWVYGIVLAVLGGSSGNFGNSGGSSSRSPSPENLKNLPEQIPDETRKVLGAATDAITQWVNSVSPFTWITVGLALLTVLSIGMVIIWITKTWAKAGLIAGMAQASRGQPVTLETTAKSALSSIRPLIHYGVLLFLFGLAAFVVWGIVLAVNFALIAFVPVLGTIIGIFLGLVLAVIMLICIVFFSIISVYAERLIVLQNLPPMAALKKSYRLTRKHVGETLIMGLLNNVIGCTAGCLSMLAILMLFIPAAVISVMIIGGSWSEFTKNPMAYAYALPWFAGGGLLLLMLFFSLIQLTNAIIIVWKYGTWNEFFAQIMKSEESTP